MPLPAELELLDYLGAHDESYLYLERCVFDNDRGHALRSIEKMWEDGLIDVTINGRPIEIWRWQEWRRAPRTRATSAALDCVRLGLSDRE
jgi:hypothetical protein